MKSAFTDFVSHPAAAIAIRTVSDHVLKIELHKLKIRILSIK